VGLGWQVRHACYVMYLTSRRVPGDVMLQRYGRSKATESRAASRGMESKVKAEAGDVVIMVNKEIDDRYIKEKQNERSQIEPGKRSQKLGVDR
jgi:hypothetical protein